MILAVALAMALASPLAGLSAATVPDLVLLGQLTPENPRRGETAQLDLQALQGASFVDLDNLTARIIFYNGTEGRLVFAHNGTGRYNASFVLPLEVTRIDFVKIIAEGYRAGKRGVVQVWVAASDMPHFVSPGLMLFGTLYSEGPLPYHFAPGDRLRHRVWTFLNGTLQDVGTPIGGGYLRPHNWLGGMLPSLRTNTTRVGTGTYDIVTTLPSDIHVTNWGYISAAVPNITATYGPSFSFEVDPFPAVAWFENVWGQGGDLRVCAARGDTPLSNASVTVDVRFDRVPPSGNPVTRGFLTGEDGCGRAGFEWPSNATYKVSAEVAIRSGGDTTYRAPQFTGSLDTLTAESVVPLPGGFVVELVGEPRDVPPGGEAQMSFVVTQAGSPYANATIGVVETWSRGDLTQVPIRVANVSTDSSGFLNLSYSVPEAWTPGLDYFSVSLYTPQGDEAPFNFAFGPYSGSRSWPGHDTNLTVTAEQDVENGTLRVHAAYGGGQEISGWRVAVFVIPKDNVRCCYGWMERFPTAEVPLNGSAVDAHVVLPPWLWEGDFRVVVMPYTFGRSLVPDHTLSFENSTVVHLHARPHPPSAPIAPAAPATLQPTDKTAGLLADLNFALLLLLMLLAAAAAAVFVASRRRTSKDEEEPR